ncbi:hypothetical protein F4809DRAFT_636944 [Biscogniauxia mediterranea]|nr:hypothetical protein F4809DRAFT_636944 [Biscogniauxia mediterranea]
MASQTFEDEGDDDEDDGAVVPSPKPPVEARGLTDCSIPSSMILPIVLQDETQVKWAHATGGRTNVNVSTHVDDAALPFQPYPSSTTSKSSKHDEPKRRGQRRTGWGREPRSYAYNTLSTELLRTYEKTSRMELEHAKLRKVFSLYQYVVRAYPNTLAAGELTPSSY